MLAFLTTTKGKVLVLGLLIIFAVFFAIKSQIKKKRMQNLLNKAYKTDPAKSKNREVETMHFYH